MAKCMELQIPEFTEKLIQWREEQARSSSHTLHGIHEKAILVGWESANAVSLSKDEKLDKCISFSFEIEGNSARITDFFRPEAFTDEEWLSKSLQDRMAFLKNNWTKLKKKINRDNSPYWFNENLTIEGTIFLHLFLSSTQAHNCFSNIYLSENLSS